jgi:hypothetical protein
MVAVSLRPRVDRITKSFSFKSTLSLACSFYFQEESVTAQSLTLIGLVATVMTLGARRFSFSDKRLVR